MTDLAPLCRRLHALFSETADAVARQTGFVQRDSKLSGPLFLRRCQLAPAMGGLGRTRARG